MSLMKTVTTHQKNAQWHMHRTICFQIHKSHEWQWDIEQGCTPFPVRDQL